MKLACISLAGKGRTDACLMQAVALISHDRLRLAGTLQSNPTRPGRPKCDMDLHVLPDGPVLRISEDRGAQARGCRLDTGALEAAVAATLSRLDGAELLVVNKFGKHEAEGRGFVPVIAAALERDLPVLVGVNPRNYGAFHEFTGGMARDLPADPAAIADWARRFRRIRVA